MTVLQQLYVSTLAMFRPPQRQTVSEWADKNRMLVSDSSAEPGPWRTERAPYQREIMDAFTQPGVHEIVLKSSSQVGKSEIELNMMGEAIAEDPGPMLYIQPTKEVAEDYSKRRIAPMIEACPQLRNLIFRAKSRDSNNTIFFKQFPGGSLAIVGANSPSELASKPVRYIFMDEIDRFPRSAGTEGSPIDLAERRTETFRHNRKIVKASTPTIKGASNIEKAYNRGTQEEWQTECPHCHTFTFIRFDDIRFDHEKFIDENGESNYLVSNSRWQCPLCKREIPEHEAKRLPAKWVSRNPKALDNGIRSFALNAFMSPWSSWDAIALTFLKAKDDPAELQVWHNTMLGESWEIKDRSGMPEKLHERREYYNAEVPTGVLFLTMGVDTQDNRLEYEVVGWGRNEESWGISRGIIPGRPDSEGVWMEIDALLDREWKMKNGMRLRINGTFVDSGGHYTQDVYRQCEIRESRKVWAIKGEPGDGKVFVRPMKSSGKSSRSNKFLIAVDAGKARIMHAVNVEEPGPNYMHFPIDAQCGYDLDYFRGLCSEKLITKRKSGQTVLAWEKIYERNEPLDCRNYALAAARYFRRDLNALENAINGKTERMVITSAQAEKKKHNYVVSKGITV